MTADLVDARQTGSGRWEDEPGAWRAGWASHPGRRRPSNDDRAAVGATFAVVADGVGSVPGSGAAAQVAVAEFTAAVTGARTEEDVRAAVTAAHERVRLLAGSGRLPAGAATTLVAAVLLGDEILLINVGDSAGWLVGDGEVQVRTAAHQRWDPFQEKFLLVSAIGAERLLEPSVTRIPVGDGCRLVLASDGVLADDRDYDSPPAVVAAGSGEPEDAARRGVGEVLGGPATDNVTVVVVDAGPWTTT